MNRYLFTFFIVSKLYKKQHTGKKYLFLYSLLTSVFL